MKPQAQFGRRARPLAEPVRRGGIVAVELTPEQRALLFAPVDGAARTMATAVAPWSRGAGLIACAAASAFAVALSLARQGAEPPDAGALAFQLLSIASNISLSCWLAHKICCWRGLGGFVAYGVAGAGVNMALSWLGAQLGLGESDLSYAADAVAGGGAALLYLRLAGRNRMAGEA
jgi:hypothetical protein